MILLLLLTRPHNLKFFFGLLLVCLNSLKFVLSCPAMVIPEEIKVLKCTEEQAQTPEYYIKMNTGIIYSFSIEHAFVYILGTPAKGIFIMS